MKPEDFTLCLTSLLNFVKAHDQMPKQLPNGFEEFKLKDIKRDVETMILIYKYRDHQVDVIIAYSINIFMQFSWKIRSVNFVINLDA